MSYNLSAVGGEAFCDIDNLIESSNFSRGNHVVTRKCSDNWSVQRLFFFLGAVCSLVISLILLVPSAQAQRAKADPGAIFLPFDIQVSGNYDYLSDGLASVLASRVATHAGIRVVHGTPEALKIEGYFKAGQQEKAFQALSNTGVDYFVMGSLAKEGEVFLLTVNVISRLEGVAPSQFERRTPTIDQALPLMDELAWDVSAEVFGVARPDKVVQTPGQDDGMSGFQTAHPDRAYKEGMYAGIMPGFDSGDLSLLEIKRSPKIPIGINDMDAGDLDGDGNVELVMAAVDQLYIYRFIEGQFAKVDSIALDGYLRVHAISLADLDGNGLLEIYVSANNEGRPESTVVEWDGRQARFLYKRVPYYLQVAAPEGKPILLGQLGGDIGTDAVIGNDVYQLEANAGGDYVRGEKISLPQGLTIFDIAFADLDNSGERKMIAITRANTLQVYDSAGNLLSTDPGQYGASSNYLGTIATAFQSNRRVYVPPRIVVRDVNHDGIADIVLTKNHMKEIKYFKRYRYFEGSSITALSWKNGALTPLWETRKLPEYTVNCQVFLEGKGKQDDEAGRFRLFFAQGQNNYTFAFWKTRSSSLFMYEIGQKKQQDE